MPQISLFETEIIKMMFIILAAQVLTYSLKYVTLKKDQDVPAHFNRNISD